jgi:hypothetical protein
VAIDTRNRRASVIGYKLPMGRVFPNPDGSLTAPDRQQLTGEYPGIAVGAPPATSGADMMLRHHHYGV